MTPFAAYQRRAEQCAQLRDRATTELGRARLARECADWRELAELALSPHPEETLLRQERSWAPQPPRCLKPVATM
jgi:hypothetical protein